MDGTSGGRVRKQMDYQTKNGHLLFGGCDTVELAREFGTPLYVLDEEMLVENCQSFLRSMEKYYNGRGMVAFAGKSLCCLEVFRIMKREGMALDVVSGGELYTAAKAGFPMEKVFFHGNNKTPQEIRMALEYGVGHIVADNPVELALLEDISAELGKTAKVLFRINIFKPGKLIQNLVLLWKTEKRSGPWSRQKPFLMLSYAACTAILVRRFLELSPSGKRRGLCSGL